MTVTISGKTAIAPTTATSIQPFANVSAPLDAAQAYFGHGVALVPVPFGSKAAALKDWPNFQCDSTNIPVHFAGKTNLAAKLGTPSQGLVDIDLDCLEAVKLAPHFLPQSDCIFGRPTKPASHYLYRVETNCPTLKRQVKIGTEAPAMLLEFRSTGALLNLPPSLHPNGEQIRFETGFADLPTKVGLGPLVVAFNQLAVATLLARIWPKKVGSRNEVAMALIGGLLRTGAKPELVSKVIHRAAEAAGDEQATQRNSSVAPTEAKLKKGEPTTGWPQVGELLGSDVAKEVRTKCTMWLGLSQVGQTVDVGGGKLISTLASKIEMKAPEWLWPGWLPYGSLCVLDGDPGMGKSTLCLDLAARISKGMPLPGGHSCQPGNVIVLSGEDSMAATIKPRLEAAGADCNRVRIVNGVVDADGGKHLLSIPEDIEALATAIFEDQARLVVIEPLMGYLGVKTNAHSDQQVRRALMPLASLAEESGAVILCVRHLNKQGGKQALYRGGGSIGITGAARALLVVGKDPIEPTHRVLACAKANLAPMPKSLTYRVVSKTVLVGEKEMSIGAIEWIGTTHLSANEILGDADEQKTGAQAEAEVFLAELLKHGPMKAEDIYISGKEHGHAKKTLWRASVKLGVIKKSGHNGKFTGWTWKLAEKQDEDKL